MVTDETGTYVLLPDGKRDYGRPTNLLIDGEAVYRFDEKTGVLQLSMSASDIEILVGEIGDLPEEGREIQLPAPPIVGTRPVVFKGVKKIESISKEEGDSYLLRINPGHPQVEPYDSQ